MKRTLALTLLGVLAFCGCSGEGLRTAVTDYALNTEIKISVPPRDAKKAAEAALLCKKYERLFSKTVNDSEIARVNRGEKLGLSPETKELIEKSLAVSELSGGAFDITIAPVSALWDFGGRNYLPSREEAAAALSGVDYKKIDLENGDFGGAQLDLGGIAKGYIGDKMLALLKAREVGAAIVDLGGNIALLGGPYTVGVQSPFDRAAIFATVRAENVSIVTSGIYERNFEKDGVLYHHILDPKTGFPVQNGLASVTVVSPSGALADALSTALFVLGRDKGVALLQDFPGADALFIFKDATFFATAGFYDAYSFTLK